MPEYLLPCRCGEKLLVDARSAGQKLACRCGASVEVPTLLKLATLEPAKPPSAAQSFATGPSATASRWGWRQNMLLLGVLFAGVWGVLLAMIVLNRPSHPYADSTIDAFRTHVQTLSPEGTLRLWQSLRGTGLAPMSPLERERHEERLLRYHLSLAGVGILLAASLGLVVAPLVFRPKGPR